MTRPVNSLMVGLGVVVGVVVVAPHAWLEARTLLGLLTGALVAAYAMVVNDIYDLEVDRVNRPDRPLPAGQVKVGQARLLALGLLALGLLSAVVTTLANLVIALIFALLAWLYNAWGKETGLPGNMMVSASVAVPYIYGGFLVGDGWDPLLWLLALTSFLASTGREVVKTMADVEGDRIRGVRSVALTRGLATAARIGAAFFLAAIGVSSLPLALRLVGLAYGLLILIPVTLFLYATILILRQPTPVMALRVKGLNLLGMLTGLLAFMVGGALR